MKKLFRVKKLICLSLAVIIALSASFLCGCKKAVPPANEAPTKSSPPSISTENSSTALLAEGMAAKYNPNVNISDKEHFSASQINFATELFSSYVTKKEDNPVISPLSAMLCLSMVANGTGGETLSQFEAVLGKISENNNLSIGELNKGLEEYVATLYSDGRTIFNSSNSLWLRNSHATNINNDFLDICSTAYGADVFKTNFSKQDKEIIDAWTSEKTQGTINNFTDNFNLEDTVIFIINTLYFSAEWKTGYESTQVSEDLFTAYDGSTRNITAMHETVSSYICTDDALGFLKDYNNGYSFAALLPDESIDIYDYAASLTSEKLNNALSSIVYNGAETMLPKFSCDLTTSLNDTLTAMGIEKAFNAGSADFSNMSDALDLYLGNVAQSVFIDVTEKGTTASAATGAAVEATGIAPPFPVEKIILDRPFVYMILDSDTNIPLFMGIATDITS